MQQGDTGGPHIKQGLGFSVWSLHIPPGLVWVFSEYCM